MNSKIDHYSYSRISQYFTCARCFWLRYIAKVEVLRKPFSNDALVCGSAMHMCAQDGVEAGLNYYESQFNYLNERHVNEEIKFRVLGEPLYEMFGSHQHEVEVKSDDGFLGFIDDYDPDTKTVVDFKYSNNITHYLDSPQIHLYQYFGKQQGLEIENLAYVFIPKIAIRQRKTETLNGFRRRLMTSLQNSEIQYVPVNYNEIKVYNFLQEKDKVLEIAENHPDEIEYYPCDPKRKFCRTCDYHFFCEAQGYSNTAEPEIDYKAYEEYERKLFEEEEMRLSALK